MRIAGLGLLALGSAAAAQVTPCPAPAPFANWAKPVSLVAGEAREKGKLPTIAVGRAVTLTLAPTQAVAFELPARKTGGPIGYGGLVSFTVALPGTYRIGIDAPVWIEVGTPGRAIESAAHGHGEECSPVRKMVDYTLARGTYTLQLSAAPSPVTTVAVARLR